MREFGGEPGSELRPAVPSLEWGLALAAIAYAAMIHHGVGPAAPGGEDHWSQPSGFLLRAEALAFASTSLLRTLACFGFPAATLVVVTCVTGRSAIARALGLIGFFATLLFVFYGVAAPDTWAFFGWRGSAALTLTAFWIGTAAAAPLLAASWLRLGTAARIATYAPLALAGVAFIRNATGSDPTLRFGLSPWPAVTVFGIEVAALFFAAAFLGVAVATAVRSNDRSRRLAAAVLGVLVPVGAISAGAALALLPFAVGPRTLFAVACVCGLAIAAVSTVGVRGRAEAVQRRSRALAVGAALIAAPLLTGELLARLDYHVTRDRRAQRILDGLERHYAREQLYPDSLEELVAAGDLDALPSPAIGFRSLGGADFHYQNFGTSYLLDFAAPRWVECAYSPPYAEEEEEDDDGADEALGGSWSCPAEPPELW